MKRKWLLRFAVLCGVYSVFSWLYPSFVLKSSWFAAGKYLACVYGIVLFTCYFLSYLPSKGMRFHRLSIACAYASAGILMMYTILTLDTFVFHAMVWYPGILRYSLFSAYGILYSAWILVGILFYIGFQEVIK